MRKSLLTSALLLCTLTFGISCRETQEKQVIIEKETVVEEEKGILEKAGEKVDEEVNEEVDKAIEDIGDDN